MSNTPIRDFTDGNPLQPTDEFVLERVGDNVKINYSDLESGLSIEASQVSDFDTEVANNSAVALNTAKRTYPLADETKMATVETNAAADQTDSEIETAYNNQVALSTQTEMEDGTVTSVRRMTPERVRQAVDSFAGSFSSVVTINESTSSDITINQTGKHEISFYGDDLVKGAVGLYDGATELFSFDNTDTNDKKIIDISTNAVFKKLSSEVSTYDTESSSNTVSRSNMDDDYSCISSDGKYLFLFEESASNISPFNAINIYQYQLATAGDVTSTLSSLASTSVILHTSAIGYQVSGSTCVYDSSNSEYVLYFVMNGGSGSNTDVLHQLKFSSSVSTNTNTSLTLNSSYVVYNVYCSPDGTKLSFSYNNGTSYITTETLSTPYGMPTDGNFPAGYTTSSGNRSLIVGSDGTRAILDGKLGTLSTAYSLQDFTPDVGSLTYSNFRNLTPLVQDVECIEIIDAGESSNNVYQMRLMTNKYTGSADVTILKLKEIT